MWIDGNVDSGVRACLAEEFSSIWVVNLRGNQRTQGERSRKEGGKIFGQGSRAPVAISIFVRNPDAAHEGCRILYRDIGDYLKREEKLKALRDWGSIHGIEDWQEITPNQHHDWIDQRDEDYRKLYPMGSKAAKAGKSEEAVFELFSNGYKTGRDAYLYSFSAKACAENAKLAIEDSLPGRGSMPFSGKLVTATSYRPFIQQYLYRDYRLAQRKYRQDHIFPISNKENRAISVPGGGSTKPFSALMVDAMPDLHFIAFGQCFPRYRFEQRADAQGDLFNDSAELVRIDNITDHALRTFRARYGRNDITKDGIFNAPAYRVRFENSLSKELPRIPFAPDFDAFTEAGSRLAELHIGFESCEEWPLKIKFIRSGSPEPHHFRLTAKAMRFTDNSRSVLRIHEHVSLSEIPAAAHDYVVNGRTPLEWFIDRYRVTKDTHSGIVNDPNHWFNNPRDITAAIARIVYLSVMSSEIQVFMPEVISDDDPDATKTKAYFATKHAEAAHAIANSPGEAADQAFVDTISDLDSINGEEASEQ